MHNLHQQVALITGGAKGIGQAVAELFARQGATIILWDVTKQGHQTAEAITLAGGQASFQHIDITDRQAVKNGIEAIIKQYNRIDILINNAGIVRDRTLHKMLDEEWDQVLGVNLTGVFNVTKAVLPHMKAAGYGRIVSASSINGILGAFGQTNYAATKAGLIGFTKALAKEIGRYGITANVVAPGFIQTDMTSQLPENIVQMAIAQTPVGRMGTPEEMAQAYLFLASPEASFINGHALHANGGAF